MRCLSWRAHPAHNPAHAPGHCRRCWRPCRARIAPGQTRCQDCTEALIAHPDPAIRRNALGCHLTGEQVIRLACDLDLSVQLAAREVLTDMGIELNTDAPTITTTHTWDEES